MSQLCLHRGARIAGRDQLAAVPTPERTSSWVPIAHNRLLDGVRSSSNEPGFTSSANSMG